MSLRTTSVPITMPAPGQPPTDPDARPRRGRPPARNEILRAGRLGGLAPEELAERFGTPVYVYDLAVIDRQVAALQAVLPPVAELAYAVKANPALADRHPPGRPRPRGGRGLGRRAGDRPPSRHPAFAHRHDRAGQA